MPRQPATKRIDDGEGDRVVGEPGPRLSSAERASPGIAASSRNGVEREFRAAEHRQIAEGRQEDAGSPAATGSDENEERGQRKEPQHAAASYWFTP